MPEPSEKPEKWPSVLEDLFAQTVAAEYTTLTRSGVPISAPVTPYIGPKGTLDLSTGVTYPAKAERARNNPKVSLLFADPFGLEKPDSPVALVQGYAAVRDADLQANTDRYTGESFIKLPDAMAHQPKFLLRRMTFYFVRIWVETTPVRIRWWPDRSLSVEPVEWSAPASLQIPVSDPAPKGPVPPAWRGAPDQWRPLAQRALTLPLCDLTTVDPDGFPVSIPVEAKALQGDAVSLAIGSGAPVLSTGPASLTLHGHPVRFTGQENHTFIGRFEATGPGPRFVVDRALADWSLPGNFLARATAFLSAGKSLRTRVKSECARRGQGVPKIHLK
ncbi:MAG: hypothetical protein WAM97_11830 [Acidimicrobiales bacterium]